MKASEVNPFDGSRLVRLAINNIVQNYAAKLMHLRHTLYVIEQVYADMLGFTCFQMKNVYANTQ